MQKLSLSDNVLIIEPASFLDIVQLEQNSSLIITDSGGVQKEAYFYNKACVILREETEWIEIVESGSAICAGADKDRIIDAYIKLTSYNTTQRVKQFGDGHSAGFICDVIVKVKRV